MLTKMAFWLCVVSVLLIQLGQAENVVALRRHHHLHQKSQASSRSVADLYTKYGIDEKDVTAKGFRSNEDPESFVAQAAVSGALKAIKFTAATGASDFTASQATVMIKGVNMKQKNGADVLTPRLSALCNLVHEMATANPNIGDCYAYTVEGDYFVSVMEYVTPVELNEWYVTKLMRHLQTDDLEKQKRLHVSPTLDVSYSVVAQMAGILSTLETFSVVHPALTLRDAVLITQDANKAVMLKLVSFGEVSFLPGVASKYPDLRDVMFSSQIALWLLDGYAYFPVSYGDDARFHILNAGRQLAQFVCGHRERGATTKQANDLSPVALDEVVDRQTFCTYVTRQCGAVSLCSEDATQRERITNLWEIINLMLLPKPAERITPTALKQMLTAGADMSPLWPKKSVQKEATINVDSKLDMYFSRCFVATFNKDKDSNMAKIAEPTLAMDTTDVCDLSCDPEGKAGEANAATVKDHVRVCKARPTPLMGSVVIDLGVTKTFN